VIFVLENPLLIDELECDLICVVDTRLQQEFSQLIGEAGLEAGDGGGNLVDGSEKQGLMSGGGVDEDANGDDDDGHDDDTEDYSDSSSNGAPRILSSLGVEVSAQDKTSMIQAFLEGTASPSTLAAKPVVQETLTDVPGRLDKQMKSLNPEVNSTPNDFVTPPTKLFLRSGAAAVASNGDVVGSSQRIDESMEINETLSENMEVAIADLALHQRIGDHESFQGQSPEIKGKTRFKHQESFKSASSSKPKEQAVVDSNSGEKNGSQEGGSSWSERNQRDRKMAFIIVLCATTFVVFNAAAYLYLKPVKVGSAPFADLRMLLELQAQLDLPKSRFFPILSHVVSLMNPRLTGTRPPD
jgi:hypothetical protein